uniref:Beta-defensin 136 n=1 Tax=Equus caballus TaxID=9796 RepID=F6VL80_HORSE
ILLKTDFSFPCFLFPSGHCLFGVDGVEIRTCKAIKGRCFFGCKPGWQWVAYCHNVMSCCKEMKINKPPQALLP